ncbi:MAG: acetolactate decarboxylase [Acidobacteriota bacterium]
MKKSLLVLPLILFVLIGCAATRPDTLTQVSTIDALLAGSYDGQMSLRDLLAHGDMGIGTFNRLDGEMVVLDGQVYQVRVDGKIYSPSPTETTPFASVVKFRADARTRAEAGLDFKGLERIVNETAPNQNLFCAVKVTGRFRLVKTRSVPVQNKPYPPLAEVTANQPVFTLENVSGTLLGFRSPAYVKGINVPGYHLHFISDDRSSGGHVLELAIEQGTVEVDTCNRFLMILPESGGDFARVDLGRDRSKELEKVEK